MLRLVLPFAMLLSLPASAQTVSCADRAKVVARLSGLGETQAGMGLSTKGQVFEIWTSNRTGTWTIVLSDSSGLSCIMSYGESWTGQDAATVSLPGEPT
ncbi:MAG: hypothetical protein QNJ16_04355 [Rhodobacter sp.]|nr:hypothetical protein [Rhodobacter sp.]